MSQDVDGAAPLAAGAGELLALRILARTAAFEAISGSVRLSSPDGRREARVSAATWNHWQSARWISILDASAHVSLTRRGRQELRRRLSQGPGSNAAAVARALPARERPRQAASVPGLDPAESPLGWLYRRLDKSGAPLISEAEFEAGERLRADFTRAHLMPRTTMVWGPATGAGAARRAGPGGAADLLDHAVAARARVNAALDAVGPEMAGLLVDVCCHLKGLEQAERLAGWPQRSGKVVLRLALAALARHYGLGQRREAGQGSRAAIRHWGADGYRPAAETAGDANG